MVPFFVFGRVSLWDSWCSKEELHRRRERVMLQARGMFFFCFFPRIFAVISSWISLIWTCSLISEWTGHCLSVDRRDSQVMINFLGERELKLGTNFLFHASFKLISTGNIQMGYMDDRFEGKCPSQPQSWWLKWLSQGPKLLGSWNLLQPAGVKVRFHMPISEGSHVLDEQPEELVLNILLEETVNHTKRSTIYKQL